MDPLRIDVATDSRTYPIIIGEGLLARLPSLLDDAGVGAVRFAVSSPLVWKLHGEAVRGALSHAEPLLVPDGERSKHLQTVSRIYDALACAEADRSTGIIAVGGGVIGDMAGFAAATYLRGVGLVHVPTTLLAQVDSAIGGKVGVNHALGKNLIGAFYPPALTAIDPALLRTLPRREFRAGLYEVVKYGMACSRDLFDRLGREFSALFARDPAVLIPTIAACCRLKAAIVSADEREAGPRRVLNFGHTAGHAFEALTKYRRFRHGEAVAYGMLVAADLAVARGALANTDRQALVRTIQQLGPLPPIGDLSTRQMLDAIRHDKKFVGGTLHFVLPVAVGAVTIVDDVTERELRRALRDLGCAA